MKFLCESQPPMIEKKQVNADIRKGKLPELIMSNLNQSLIFIPIISVMFCFDILLFSSAWKIMTLSKRSNRESKEFENAIAEHRASLDQSGVETTLYVLQYT